MLHSSIVFVILSFLSFTLHAQAAAENKIHKIPMTLKWNSIDGAVNYSVMISRTPHFYQSRAFKMNTTSFPIEVEPKGTYYWLVTALNENDEEISDKPVITFEPTAKGTSITQLTPKGETMERTRVSSDSSSEETPSTETPSSSPPPVAQPTVLGLTLDFELEGGLLSFTQQHPLIANIKTDGLLFPSFSIGLVTPEIWDLLSFKFHLQQNISDFKSNSSTVTLQNNSFRWLGYGVESIFKIKTDNWIWQPYLSLQKISTPFFTVSGSVLDIQEINYLNGGVGLRLNYLRDPTQWQYMFDVSYLTALSTDGSDFSNIDNQSGTFLNLELATSKKLTSTISTAFFVKGQMTKLEELVTFGSTTSEGSRESTYWGLGARLSIDF